MSQIFDHTINTPMSWTSETVLDQGGLVHLDDECLQELDVVV